MHGMPVMHWTCPAHKVKNRCCAFATMAQKALPESGLQLPLSSSFIKPVGPRNLLAGCNRYMVKEVTKSQVFLARLVVVLIVVFVVAGLLWYGFSAEVRARIAQNLFERPGGPLVFRFFLQPTMAAIAAWRDGVNDARTGRTPFFAGALTDPAQRTVRLNEALVATARIILLGLVMDGIYQAIEFN